MASLIMTIDSDSDHDGAQKQEKKSKKTKNTGNKIATEVRDADLVMNGEENAISDM